MGKGTKRHTSGYNHAATGAGPHPALLGGVVLAAVLILGQQFGGSTISFLQQQVHSLNEQTGRDGGGRYVVVEDGRLTPQQARRAENLARMWQSGGIALPEDLEWMVSVALALPVGSDMDEQQLFYLKAAHATAVQGALSLDDTALAVSLSKNMAKSIYSLSKPEARIDVYKGMVRSWVEGEEARISTVALPAVDIALEGAKLWNHGVLVTAIYLDKVRAFRWPSRDLNRSLEEAESCVAWANAYSHSNDSCVHALILTTQYVDQLDRSMALYEGRYRHHLQDFRSISTGRQCSPALHLLSVDTVTPSKRAAVPRVTVHRDAKQLEEFILSLPPLGCSNQTWPYFMHSEALGLPSDKFDIVHQATVDGDATWSVGQWKGHRFHEVRCITHADKRPILLEFDDVFIHGPDRTISSVSECAVYHVGFPFSSLTASPTKSVTSLPVKELHQAGMLSMLQANFFHMLVDESQQTSLGRLFDAWPQGHTPYLVGVDKMIGVVMPHLAVPVEDLVPYLPGDTVYHVEKLFVTDWEFVENDGAARHTEDYFMPAQPELRVLRHILMQGVELPSKTGARTVVFVNRDPANTRQRSLPGFQHIVNELRRTAARHGAIVHIHDDSKPLSAQIQTFHSASVVVGPHGAGLANVLFCKPGTAVIELPTFPYKPSVYAMISAALQLQYWTLPGADGNFWASYHLTSEDVARLCATLEFILSNQ